MHTSSKGLLGKAVFYTLNQWKKLIGYIEDERLDIDNNLTENGIRPFVLGRTGCSVARQKARMPAPCSSV